MKTMLSISFIICLVLGVADLAYLNLQIVPQLIPENEIAFSALQKPSPLSVMPVEMKLPPADEKQISPASVPSPATTIAMASALPDTASLSGTPTATDAPAARTDTAPVAIASVSPASVRAVNTEAVTPGRQQENPRENKADPVPLAEITLLFDPGHFALSTDQKSQLITMLRGIQNPEHVWVRINGHADRTGLKNNVNNSLLSQQRADFVAGIVAAEGFSMSRIIKIGYGASTPVDRSNDPAAWAMNRRAVVQLYSGKKP